MFVPLLLFLAPPQVIRDVVFAHVAPLPVKMDIYQPAGAKAGDKLATVVVVHGGAWVAGKREEMADLCKALAENGMVAATVDYRLAPQSKWPAMLDDVQTAVRFLRANATRYDIDPERIGAAGASAGGHLALFLGERETRDPKPAEYAGYSSRVRAVFDMFAPTDASREFTPQVDFLFTMVLGKPKKDAAAELRDASPINFVDAASAPTFILHGLADPLVPVEQSRLIEQKFRDNKVPVESAYIEGMGHGVDVKLPKAVQAVKDAIAWLQKYLAPQSSRAGRLL